MPIRFYNTLNHKPEELIPVDPPRIHMYNCGPTVYDYAHIGNFRAFVFADVLRRFLELAGYQVHQVMNLTDVGHMTEDDLADGAGEDKMNLAMKRMEEAKKAGQVPQDAVKDPNDPFEVAGFFIQSFLEDARRLGLKVADEYPKNMPRATDHIEPMQSMVRQLIEKGHAYVATDGAVYFSVETFPEYGRLSGNTIDQLRGGAGGRLRDEHQAAKRHPADFLLWKPDDSHVMKWDSPWGTGYPGWHLECSAMARTLLGRDTIDIHTGGEDNIFPHHECEIAQTCGATGSDHFARVWMHARFLLVEGEKMSKSKGNFYTVRDVLEGKLTGKPVHQDVLRYELLRTNYRSNMNFTRQGLTDVSANAVERLRTFRGRLVQASKGNRAPVDLSHPMLSAFVEALSDDLNISAALGELFKWEKNCPDKPDVALGVLDRVDSVLNMSTRTEAGAPDDEVEQACRRIDDARARKDFDTADQERARLIEAGYEVTTSPQGTSARKKLA